MWFFIILVILIIPIVATVNWFRSANQKAELARRDAERKAKHEIDRIDTAHEEHNPSPDKPAEYGRCRMLNPWDDWDYALHAEESQIKRQGYALQCPSPEKVDTRSMTAQFSSEDAEAYYATIYAGTYVLPPFYETSLSSCTCEDFLTKQQPCKHIYRLAAELGIIEIFRRPSFDRAKYEEVKNSDDVDNHPEQIKRKVSSKKCTIISIDYESGTAIFKGSKNSSYETTVDKCTCHDHSIRRLPCKHMYRLRDELNAT